MATFARNEMPAVERFPPRLFLRSTRLTAADEAIRDFAERARAGCEGNALAQARALLEALHREVAFDLDMTGVVPSASEAFALKRGVCRDHCHIFLASQCDLQSNQ
jgi:transglutaminase-like putative cysteine protease